MSKINKMEVHNYFNQTDNYLKKDFGVRVRSTIVKNLFNGIKNKSPNILPKILCIYSQ